MTPKELYQLLDKAGVDYEVVEEFEGSRHIQVAVEEQPIRKDGDDMKEFIVLYRQESVMTAVDAPFGFRCSAEDSDHAEEQCMNAYPDCDVVWVWEGGDMRDALDDYWNVSDFNKENTDEIV